MRPTICVGIPYVHKEPVTIAALKVYVKFSQFSVPFGALLEYVSESEDVV